MSDTKLTFTFEDNGETIPFEDVFIKHNIDPNSFIEALYETDVETSIVNIEHLLFGELEAKTFFNNGLVINKGECVGKGRIVSITAMRNEGFIHWYEENGQIDGINKNITRLFLNNLITADIGHGMSEKPKNISSLLISLLLNNLGVIYDAKSKTINVKIGSLDTITFKLSYDKIEIISVNDLIKDLGFIDGWGGNDDHGYSLANIRGHLIYKFAKERKVKIGGK